MLNLFTAHRQEIVFAEGVDKFLCHDRAFVGFLGKYKMGVDERSKSSEIKGFRFFALKNGADPSSADPVPPFANGWRPIALINPV
jgi:hypothetical protein